ncbi:response regulator [Chryseomicrobium sp. FSL W7-1435]|uniref:response regulator n=1 Tax=Chryseomicrobium sp. FSL W7-1435 TaxID=2921704 RepID=UPI0031599C9A
MTDLIEVLIVEDDPRIARIHEKFVAAVDGFQTVGIAHSVAEAKIWLEELQPKLILLDVYLPDGLGIHLADYVKMNHSDIDIILITAATEMDVVRKAYSVGIEDYLIKPLTMQSFIERLSVYRMKQRVLMQDTQLTEEQIKQLFQTSIETAAPLAPKGIDRLTRDKVMGVLANFREGITAESLGQELGMSRSTARRYLEYLVSEKTLSVEQVYGTVGRPERRYFLI